VADRFQVDDKQVIVGGDSAGAQIASQIATLVTNRAYAYDAANVACGFIDLPPGASFPKHRRWLDVIQHEWFPSWRACTRVVNATAGHWSTRRRQLGAGERVDVRHVRREDGRCARYYQGLDQRLSNCSD